VPRWGWIELPLDWDHTVWTNANKVENGALVLRGTEMSIARRLCEYVPPSDTFVIESFAS
jgi:hypothetical protein